jgi:putative copper resistance protein D
MRTEALIALITVVLRAATLVSQSLLVGGVVFRRWVAAGPAASGEPGPGIRLLRCAAIGLAVAQAMFLGLNVMVLRNSLGLNLLETISANFFVVGMVTISAALAIAVVPSRLLARPGNLITFLSMVALACGVLGSHAASRVDQRGFLIAFTALHQAGAAVWIGGLPQLWISLRGPDPGTQAATARRFSRLALISVLVLGGTGMAMVLRYIDAPSALYGTSYGVMVAIKVVFFLVLIAIGAFNRKLVQSFLVNPETRSRMLRHMLEAEIGIGITAILAAASLTSQPPAADLKIGRASAAEIYERMKPEWPRLSSSRLAEISGSSLQATKRARQLGLPPPPAHENTSADIAWSEYNHHWAGIFVLLLGVLAALAQRRNPGSARYWPLLLVGLAVFVFLRADPEGWPLGPDRFTEAIQNGEVLQHKAFALLILLFGLFELRVQLGKVRSLAAYAFPAVCALGGALLLTHSHSLINIKEQLLAELSHAPIAVAAVLAGWSRWLELSLPGGQNKWMTRLWPACFVAIGAVLLNYREA